MRKTKKAENQFLAAALKAKDHDRVVQSKVSNNPG